LGKRCIIDKRKLKLVYILFIISAIMFITTPFYHALLIPAVILFTMHIYVTIKYIKCSNCESVIFFRNFNKGLEYCKYCGARIEFK